MQVCESCHICFDLFGRVVKGKKDPLYLSAKSKKKKMTKRKMIKQRQMGPAANTRFQHPTGFLLPSRPTSFSTTREVTRKQQKVDREIHSKNPSNMYLEYLLPIPSSGKGVAKWWLDSRGHIQKGITLDVNCLRKAPVESHVYLQAERVAFSTHSHDIERVKINNTQKSFLDIICSAIALRVKFDRADQKEKEGVHRAAVHHPDEPYFDQDLVSLCCLADREQHAHVDMGYAGKKNKISLCVNSDKLRPGNG
jgi:hypothetical protein